MPIQKLLPNYFPSGSYYNLSSLYEYPVYSLETSYSMEGFSGGIGTGYISQPSEISVPYVRKSISVQDNSSYLRVLSFTSGTIPTDVIRCQTIYDIPSLSIDSLKLRFLYSGDVGSNYSCNINYYIYNPPYNILNGPLYNFEYIGSTFGSSGSAITHSGDPYSSFALFETPLLSRNISNSNSSWSINDNLFDNLILSGSPIAVVTTFTVDNRPNTYSVNPAFSAFEIEISGEILGKACDLFINGPVPGSGSVDLFITGNYPSKSLDLVTYGAYPANNNVSLVIDGFFPSGNLDLYLQSDPIPTSGINFYIENHAAISGNKSLNLVINNYVEHSGDLTLFMEGGGHGNDSGNLNLYMYSKQPSGTLPIYIHNVLDYKNKEVNLYTISKIPTSGDLPLFINGGGIDLRQNELILFTRSSIQNSGDVSLSIVGNIATGPINLYINAKDVVSTSGEFPILISSALNSGIYNSFDISVKAGGHEASLPMFMPVDSTGSSASNINMVLLNDTTSKKDVFLYIENNLQTQSANYTLFTQGNGILNGGSIYNSSMNLFINRSDESLANIVPMTIMGPSGINNIVPLMIKGGTISESGITLSMPSTLSTKSNQMNFFNHGF